MENLYKQYEESVTRWVYKIRRDEFFVTRVRLTALYTILAIVFLCAFSYVLYGSLLGKLTESAQETIIDSNIRTIILSRYETIIQNLILLGDTFVLFIVVVVGFFLTKKTLEPIQNMMKKQNRFIADASHELRTPLAVMKTNIEVSLRKKDLAESDMKNILTDTLEEVNNLTVLSNDLLNISRDSSTNIVFVNIYLPDLLNKIVNRIKPIAENKNVSLSLTGYAPTEKFILGGESIVGQIFYNLIHNAINYTNEKGEVKVEYAFRNGNYIVTITDNGMGISKKNLKHIFEPFYRADNTHTTTGSGLGLSIVKSHIELHDGAIEIKSELNKGTTVVVILPAIS